MKTLTPRWLFQYGIIDGVSNQTTPIVVDGTTYVTDPRGGVYAVNAADGHLLWSFDVTKLIGGGAREGYIFRHRGAVYADGVVYTAAGSFLLALDAKTGKPIPTFGTNGQANVILDVLKERYPEVTTPISMGYWFTSAPQVHNGVIYIGSTRSESHIPGRPRPRRRREDRQGDVGVQHHPAGRKDQGWEIAGPTWVGGERNGGGIWETPSIDPELDLLYVAVANPFGDSTKRAGMNLFTDSIIALTLDTGTAEVVLPADAPRRLGLRHRQPADALRHDRQRPAGQGAGEASKNGFLYILNRETGKPVHPIVETPVPTHTDTPGRAAVADAADSAYGQGQDDGAGEPVVADRHPVRSSSRSSRSRRCSRPFSRGLIHAPGPAAARTTGRSPTARGPATCT